VGDLRVSIIEGNQPSDAGIGDLITAVPFDTDPGDGGLVKALVEKAVIEGEGTTWVPVAEDEAEVKFRLATVDDVLEGDDPPAAGTLTVGSEPTGVGGIATFDSSLSITPAVAYSILSQDYYLVPQVRYATEITLLEEGWPFEGPKSSGFDIWEDGCSGEDCDVNLTPGALGSVETYTTREDVGMGASSIGAGVAIDCPTQVVVFSNEVSFYVTTGNDPVFVVTHISRLDMKTVPQNGQKHIGWCVGLESPGPWNFAQQDTNGSGGLDEGDLFVGLAPKCPNKKTNPALIAPCILSRMGDDLGGSLITGYLPGGDPTKRT
jgi:hypothetical protein